MSALITTKTGLSLAVENVSSLSTPEIMKVRDSVRGELVRAGFQFNPNSVALLQVTISENARGFLLIAQEGVVNVAMVPWAGPVVAFVAERTVIGKTLVLAQRAPILDISIANQGAELWVLEPGRLVHFANSPGGWTSDRSTVVSVARPLPRDARGRLTPGPRMPDSGAAWSLDLRHSVKWAVGRNFFQDDAIGYYSLAVVGEFEVKAGVDGRTRVTSNGGSALATMDDWGSDVTSIDGSCGQSFVLATAKTDRDDFDRLQAFRLIDSQPVASGEPLGFAGPITALWPAETPAQVTAVVRNRRSGNYEAYRIAITCAN